MKSYDNVVDFTGNVIIGLNYDDIIVVTNFSALPAPATVPGQFYWCSNAQGTQWLPGSLGGTYYSAGLYYSNGTTWEFLAVPYQASQPTVNAGTDNTQFITPFTFQNSSQLASKLTGTLTSGYLFVGNASNQATGVPMSGDATISNTGALTLSTVNSTPGSNLNTFTVNGKGLITASSFVSPITAVLTGYTSGAGTISATDTILSAIQKLNGNQVAGASQWTTYASGIYYGSNVLIGSTTAPGIVTVLNTVETGTATQRGASFYQYNNGTQSSSISALKARGTVASPASVITGDNISDFKSYAHDGTSFVQTGSLKWTSTGTITTAQIPSIFTLSTMTSAGALTVGLTIDQAQNASFTANLTYGTGFSLLTGALGYSDTGILAALTSTITGYNQLLIRNLSAGSTSSSDIVVNNDQSTATTYYGDFGMNSSGFTGVGLFNQAKYVYLTATSVDLAIGTMTANSIHIAANNAVTDAISVSSTNIVTINNGLILGTVLSPAYGGTGVNNGSKTITLGGNLTTSGAFNTTFSIPQSTTYSFPNTASETLAGLGTAQTFTAQNTFSGNLNALNINILNGGTGSTYYSALSSNASGVLTLGSSGNFTYITAPATFQTNSLSLNTSGSTYTPALTTSGANTIIIGGSSVWTGGIHFNQNPLSSFGSMTYGPGINAIFDASTGTKLGTATNQKLGFWNATPVIQQTTAIGTSTYAAVGGGTISLNDTYDGYSLPQIVKMLRTIGLLA